MNWLERLNRGPGRITLDGGTVEILHWAYMPHLPNNVPHRHTFFEVCQVGAYGQGRFTVQDTVYPIAPGDVFIARPGVIHQINNTAHPLMELYWVSFQWVPTPDAEPGEASAVLSAFANSALLVCADEERRVASLWSALRAVGEGSYRPGYETQAAGLITSLVLAIAQLGAGAEAPRVVESEIPDAGDAVARLAVRYIHDNLYRPLTVAEVASHVAVSTRHLCRLFAKFTGTSPIAYIAHARMDRARGLLLRTDVPIKEVAAAVGYDDVHYFTRIFAHQIGCPPGIYRRHGGAAHVSNVQKPGALV